MLGFVSTPRARKARRTRRGNVVVKRTRTRAGFPKRNNRTRRTGTGVEAPSDNKTTFLYYNAASAFFPARTSRRNDFSRFFPTFGGAPFLQSIQCERRAAKTNRKNGRPGDWGDWRGGRASAWGSIGRRDGAGGVKGVRVDRFVGVGVCLGARRRRTRLIKRSRKGRERGNGLTKRKSNEARRGRAPGGGESKRRREVGTIDKTRKVRR